MKRKDIVGVVAGGTLLALAANHATRQNDVDTLPYDKTAPISASQRGELQTDFAQLNNYWASKGMGTGAMKLVFVQSGEKFICTDGKNVLPMRGDDPDNFKYCHPSNTLSVSQAYANSVNYVSEQTSIPARRLFKLLVAHEIGHNVQDANGAFSEEVTTVSQLKELELHADCLAGQAIAEVSPESLANAADLYTIGNPVPDPTHGSAQERFASFEYGASNGNC